MARIDRYHGVMLVDKPSGITSHDAVAAVRQIARQRSVGHTGTLDPLADGLLVMCLGRATKIARFISNWDKTYEATIQLGLTSTTYDAEGVDPRDKPANVPELSHELLTGMLQRFEGRILQQVPAFSAVRVNGKRLHQLARQGKSVKPPQREVKINSIELFEFGASWMRIIVSCGSGTYIRSLAHMIGEYLGCGGYLAALRRTTIGRFSVDKALALQEIARQAKLNHLDRLLLALEEVLDYSALKVSDEFSDVVVTGQQVKGHDIVGVEGHFTSGDQVVLKDTRGRILAIGRARVSSDEVTDSTDAQLFRYERVLN
jgi:tRNA pseudouridine55 synthase